MRATVTGERPVWLPSPGERDIPSGKKSTQYGYIPMIGIARYSLLIWFAT